jgi:hypothetical protein
MAFDDTFRPRSYIHEHDTFDVLGKPMRLQEIKPSNFDGPVAEWAEYRAAFYNEMISPVMTFPEADGDDIHRVSWVYHAERDSETGFINAEHHHIACDCSMMAELSGEPDSIFECPTLQKTINRRAGLIRGTLMLDRILRACRDSEDSHSKVTLDRQFYTAETIMWIMRQDREHPESWMGNVVSGEHTVSLLALIVQEPPDNLRVLVEDLTYDDRLEFDGETVKLPLAA